MICGMFGGPAFNLLVAVVQYEGAAALTIGRVFKPNISSALILGYLSFTKFGST